RDRPARTVASQPCATKPLGRGQCGSAATEEIGHEIAGTGAGENNPFEQSKRFLGRPTDPLQRDGGKKGNVPHVSQRRPIRVKVKAALLRGLIGSATIVRFQAIRAEFALSLDIEYMPARTPRISQYCVMLTGEPATGHTARAIVPDDFVQE